MAWAVLFALALCIAGTADVVYGQDTRVSRIGTSVRVIDGEQFRAYGGATGRVFLVNTSPYESINIFATNLSGATSHNLTITTFFTGKSIIPDFTNNQAFWAGLPASLGYTGTYQSVNVITSAKFTAQTTVLLATLVANAAQVAIKVSGGDASSDTFAIYITFTSNGSLGSSQVQGILPNGSPFVGNPVVIAGFDASGNMSVPFVLPSSGAQVGMVIFTSTQAFTGALNATSNVLTLGPSGGNGSAPLGVELMNSSTQAPSHITTATTTTTCASRCQLNDIIINHPVAASTVTVQCPSGTTIGIIDSVAVGNFHYGQSCGSVAIITSAATDVTVLFQQ